MNDFVKQFIKIGKGVSKEVSEYVSDLETSIYSNIDEYIDTGSYSLNRLISGSIFGGIPRGRVTALAGQCVTGDTMITIRVNGVEQDITIKDFVERIY